MAIRSIYSVMASAAALAVVAAPAAVTAQPAPSARAEGPQKLVDKAASVIVEMKQDPKLAALMRRAVGFYIIPEYGRAGVIFGGKGGAGVVVAKTGKGWSSPAFFDTGGLNFGLQIGASGGSIVYLLMDRKAVEAFTSKSKFTLDAAAGFSVVTYSNALQASTVGDAVLWTNLKGAYGGFTVGATGVTVSGSRTRDYYGRDVPPSAILAGVVKGSGSKALTSVLPH